MMLINLLGLALIIAIIWWFWLYKPTEKGSDGSFPVIIVENGVYIPSRIAIPSTREAQLVFLRKDASPCAGTLLIPQLDISAELPVGKQTRITLPPLPAGTYDFSCQMQMYRGELNVKDDALSRGASYGD